MLVLWIFFFLIFFVISSKNVIGVISFSAVFQEPVLRKSLHFIAKRKQNKVFWKDEGKTW